MTLNALLRSFLKLQYNIVVYHLLFAAALNPLKMYLVFFCHKY